MPAESLLPYRDPQLPLEQRVSDLLARMTLEEKAGAVIVHWAKSMQSSWRV